MMKKQLKRLFAMLLALSMSLALLAGCGDTANDPGGNGVPIRASRQIPVRASRMIPAPGKARRTARSIRWTAIKPLRWPPRP